jgi:hypothetical protein
VPSPDVDSALSATQIVVGPDNTVYLGLPAGLTRSIPRTTIPGRVVALSGTDGATKWSKQVGASPGWMGLTPDGTLVVEDRGAGFLRGLTSAGTERFALPIDGQAFGVAIGKDSLTYVMDGAEATYGIFGVVPARRRLRALLSDGTVTVSRVLGERGGRLLGIGPEGTVYVTHADGPLTYGGATPELRALTADGRDRWKSAIWSAEGLGAPVARKDGAIVIGDNNAVYVFSPRLAPLPPVVTRVTLTARAATFRIEGPPSFCVKKVKQRCVRQAPPLGTMLRLDLPGTRVVQFQVKRLDGKRPGRILREQPRFAPTTLQKGSNWISFPECCLLRFLPDQQSPTLAPGRYRISAAGASTVITIAAPPKGFKRGIYDS